MEKADKWDKRGGDTLLHVMANTLRTLDVREQLAIQIAREDNCNARSRTEAAADARLGSASNYTSKTRVHESAEGSADTCCRQDHVLVGDVVPPNCHPGDFKASKTKDYGFTDCHSFG